MHVVLDSNRRNVLVNRYNGIMEILQVYYIYGLYLSRVTRSDGHENGYV